MSSTDQSKIPINPSAIVREIIDGAGWAATGTTGLVTGKMMRMPHFSKMAGSETFQETWAVKLDRETRPGDCGSWVLDVDGKIYGHIFAGDPISGLAFIVPAYKVFDHIRQRFGSEPLISKETNLTSVYARTRVHHSQKGRR